MMQALNVDVCNNVKALKLQTQTSDDRWMKGRHWLITYGSFYSLEEPEVSCFSLGH